MTKKNGFFKKGDIAELREWTRLILDNAEIQSEIESGKMPPEEAETYVTGREAHEANIYIARQIVQALQAKINTWEKMIDNLPKEDAPRS